MKIKHKSAIEAHISTLIERTFGIMMRVAFYIGFKLTAFYMGAVSLCLIYYGKNYADHGTGY